MYNREFEINKQCWWEHSSIWIINLSFLYAGLSFDRPKKQRRERCEPDPEEKKKYQDEANQFAMSLVDGLGDPDGNNIKLSLILSIKKQIN